MKDNNDNFDKILAVFSLLIVFLLFYITKSIIILILFLPFIGILLFYEPDFDLF